MKTIDYMVDEFYKEYGVFCGELERFQLTDKQVSLILRLVYKYRFNNIINKLDGGK